MQKGFKSNQSCNGIVRFAVTQQGLVRISGHWAAGGREILPEQKAGLEGHGLYHLSSAQLPAVGSCM